MNVGVGIGLRNRQGGGGPAAIVFDSFIDANGTNLTAHVMDVGSGWTAQLGGAQTQSNQAKGTATDSILWTDAGTSGHFGTASFDLTWAATDTQANIYAASNGTYQSGWLGYHSIGSGFRIYEQGNVLRGTNNTELVDGSVNHYELKVSASAVVFSLNNVAIITYSAAITSYGTHYGFEFYKAAGTPTSTIDNFQVTSP